MSDPQSRPFFFFEVFEEHGAVAGARAIYDDAERMMVEPRHLETVGGLEMRDRWKQQIDVFDCLVLGAKELMDEFDERYPFRDDDPLPTRVGVLRELAADANLVGSEIGLLLRNGYPGGASARWRSLHELNVVARVIGDGDDALALRFTEHEVFRHERFKVEAHRLSKRHPVVRSPGSDITRRAQRRIDEMKERHGPEFLGDYGWAHERMLNDDSYRARWERGQRTHGPQMGDLQRFVDLDVYGQDYAAASFSVHASSKMRHLHSPELMQHLVEGPVLIGFEVVAIPAIFSLVEMPGEVIRAHPDPPDAQLLSAFAVQWELGILLTDELLAIRDSAENRR